ncbi:MAG: hypothetical protein M1570_18620 [Chloroflexi bacterium]|nr:hypothetical protein [Chloroflexota bacterium]
MYLRFLSENERRKLYERLANAAGLDGPARVDFVGRDDLMVGRWRCWGDVMWRSAGYYHIRIIRGQALARELWVLAHEVGHAKSHHILKSDGDDYEREREANERILQTLNESGTERKKNHLRGEHEANVMAKQLMKEWKAQGIDWSKHSQDKEQP